MCFAIVPLPDGLLESFIGGFAVQQAGPRAGGRNAFERATLGERDHGLAAGQRLHRGDTEVFFARHQKSPAARVEFSQIRIAHASAELDIARGERVEAI